MQTIFILHTQVLFHKRTYQKCATNSASSRASCSSGAKKTPVEAFVGVRPVESATGDKPVGCVGCSGVFNAFRRLHPTTRLRRSGVAFRDG
jgi:hypothetical protein